MKTYCDKPKPRGKFNDEFFKQLGKTDLIREVTLVVSKNSAETLPTLLETAIQNGCSTDHLNTLTSLSYQEEELRSLAEAGEGSFDGIRSTMTGALKSEDMCLKGSGWWTRYPDAMSPDGTPIEIKGPGDEWRPGQFNDYKKVRKDGKVIEVSCQTCNSDCTDGNMCPQDKAA